MKHSYLIFLFCALFSFPASLQAAEGTKYNTDKPIEITANELEVLQKDQVAEFRGNVIAVQGDLKMTSDVMTVHYKTGEQAKADGQSISSIEVKGNVFLSTPEETAEGKSGYYDVMQENITLTEDVVLTRGENVVKGRELVYDLKTGRSQIVGAAKAQTKDGKPIRVRGFFVPAKKTDKETSDVKAQEADQKAKEQTKEKEIKKP